MTGWLMRADWLTDAWAGAMWRACWQGGLALLVVWAWCRLIAPRRTPARVKCWLWRLAYAKLLLSLAWFAPAALPLLPGHREPSPVASAGGYSSTTTERRTSNPLPAQATAAASFVGNPIDVTPIPAAQGDSGTQIWHPWRSAALFVWLVGFALVIVRLAFGWRATVLLRRRCTLVQDAELLEVFADLARENGLTRPPPLAQADGITSPLLLGVRRPLVVVPAALASACPPGELRLMLAHELAHLRRRDLLWNALPAAAQAVFWFHPLVLVARRESRLAQEVACDEAAVAVTGSRPAEYARALLGIVDRCARATVRPRLVAVGVFENGRTLERRLVAMKHYPNWTGRRQILAICAITCVAAVGIPSWRLVAKETPQKDDRTVKDKDDAEKSSPRDGEEAPSGRDRPATRPVGGAKEAFTAVGRVSAPRVEIKALTGGMIRSSNLEDGRRVKQNALLVQLDDTLEMTQVAAAEADLKLKEALLNRTLDLYKDRVAQGKSLPDIDEARAGVDIARISVKYRQASLAHDRILAPFEGVIVSAKARAGQVISAGDVLATLVDLDHPTVDFAVSERDSTRIPRGAPVTVSVSALERNFTGKVEAVSDQVDPGAGTVAVKATLDGPVEGLKTGMSAVVAVEGRPPTTRNAGN